jgi:hypothetical protein
MAIKLTKRKGFNFFRSYYDVYNELETNEDKVAFIDALLDRQFLGIKPVNLKGMAKFAYISQTNSIDSQVKGYEDKTKTILNPTQGGCEGVVLPPTEQVEEKGEEKEEVKEKVNRTNKFVPPTILEVEGYFLENGYTSESGKKAFNYYNVASWKDSTGKQVKNWKQKMQSVWFKDENKIEPIKKEFNYQSVRGKLS